MNDVDLQAWLADGARPHRRSSRAKARRTAAVELDACAERIGLSRMPHRMNTKKLAVLLYHHIGPPRPDTLSDLTVSPEKFERHVRWLARRGFVGIRPSDWLRWLRDGTGLPNKPILFTFDDGYADIADYALPVSAAMVFPQRSTS